MEINNGEFGTSFVKNTETREQTTERFLPQVCQVTVINDESNKPKQYVFYTSVLGDTPSDSSLRISIRKDNETYSIRAWFGNHTYLDFTDISVEEYKVLEQKMRELGNPNVEYDLDSLISLLRDSNHPEYDELLAKYDTKITDQSLTSQKLLRRVPK